MTTWLAGILTIEGEIVSTFALNGLSRLTKITSFLINIFAVFQTIFIQIFLSNLHNL